MTENNRLKQLIRNRGSIKYKLTSLEKFIATVEKNPTCDHNDVKVRFESNSSLLQEFDAVQSAIESECEEDDLDTHYNERDEFQERYYKTQIFYNTFLAKTQPSSSPASNSSSINHSATSQSQGMSSNSNVDPLQNVLLPKIKLPSFSGEFSQWLSFKTNFNSIVSTNSNLNENQKYQFLKASLEGYALRIIEIYENTDQPFQSGWKLLSERFDKKQFLLDSHFKSILDIPPINKENFTQFRKLLDSVTKHLAALGGLKITKEDLYDLFIIHVLSSKLDQVTTREWKEFKYAADLPALEEFFTFLKDKSDLLQSLDNNSSSNNRTQPRNIPQRSTNLQMNVAVNHVNKNCNYCKRNHTIYSCPDFLRLTIDDRIRQVKGLNLCDNCLLTGHTSNSCKLGNCKICKIHKHNTLLHKDITTVQSSSNNNRQQSTNVNLVVPNTLPELQVIPTSANTVLLSTVVCQVSDNQGRLHSCRALLDSGAQSTLVTNNFCRRLNINQESTNISIIGINQIVSNLNKKCTLTLFSSSRKYSCSVSCLVVPTITNEIPSHYIYYDHWRIPEGIELADPAFNCPREVDILLSAGIFWDLLLEGKIELGTGRPTLQNTVFGWIVGGALNQMPSSRSMCHFNKVHIPEDEQLKKFWQLEEVQYQTNQFVSREDAQCENLFETNTIRSENGQFIVKLPLKHSPALLGESRSNAMRRFEHLEKKFNNNVEFKRFYFNFIQEYIDLGHMTEVSSNVQDSISYFLPHHGVLKEDSITTKLRVVFDGSSQSASGWSLNDLQYVGPKVQNDIVDILLRFRTYNYVVSADVSKMYRQILMHPEHRQLHQILWRENPNENFKVYQLNTVTYGTRAAPYLAIKCLQAVAKLNQNQFPQASKSILSDFYVDDLLTGSNDLQELKTRCEEIFGILQSANFILRKWTSNDSEIISSFTETNISNAVLNIGGHDSCKTLGIQWITKMDELKYSIKSSSEHFEPTLITKRHILSTIAQIYDPLGLLSPSIILAKILMQKLWTLHISWDTPIPADRAKTWLTFHKSLSDLNSINIPRNAISKGSKLEDLHCFCDASQDAYAACVYLRSKNSSGDYSSRLLCSKTKVAPLKTITIPKLELCACLLGAQLVGVIMDALKVQVPVFMWSDSQVALCWIQTEPSLLQVFVANRVSKIQSISDITTWRYINTKSNPADLASRGVMPKDLIGNELWWNGPSFLKACVSDFPITKFHSNVSPLPELKKNVKVLSLTSACNNDKSIFHRYSDLKKLQRVIAYCLRFINNCLKLKGQNHQAGPLNVTDLNNANNILVKRAQFECFPSELELLRTTGLSPKHKLSSLAPFLDSDGIIRVGGRLRNTYLPFSIKHPILLSGKHNFTRLIFENKHKVLLHPGPQLLLSSIRQFYWPVGGRVLAKSTVKNCMTCFKFNPIPLACPMSNLPNDRIRPSLPFEITGLDYAGPFSILNRKGRGAKIVKCYLAVFVCFCTKAIHLEVVSDLTTECFLASLRRFTSRRGIPSKIYSDNGSTFVGANNALKILGHFLHKNHASIVDQTAHVGIKWIFIPPYTPNHGGLWEAAVKSCKHFLKRILINCNVTFEEFSTLTVQVEGILNSRPLFAMSNDPNDPSPITPSHFLIGRVITSIPDQDLTISNAHRLTRLQHIQKLYQQFWIQFNKQYISQLHQQYKWTGPPSQIGPNALVLLKKENCQPCRWPMGRIIRLLTGKDGIARTAEIRVHNGTIIRSVRDLCPLPSQEEIDI